ncbi:MAG: hypothetical protein V3U60_10620 [Gammaproteobacteria bacterium]|jgi:hypothetical protein
MYFQISTTAVCFLMCLFSTQSFAQDSLPEQTLFTNVHVWDGTSEGVTRRINVLVEKNLIKRIRADASDAHADATIVDAPGMVLMPCHAVRALRQLESL